MPSRLTALDRPLADKVPLVAGAETGQKGIADRAAAGREVVEVV